MVKLPKTNFVNINNKACKIVLLYLNLNSSFFQSRAEHLHPSLLKLQSYLVDILQSYTFSFCSIGSYVKRLVNTNNVNLSNSTFMECM